MTKPGHVQENLGGTLFTGYEEAQATPTDMPSESVAPQEIQPPLDEIMEAHERRIAERAARWEELTDANWLPGRIDEKLDAEFPDLRDAEKNKNEDRKQDAVQRRHAQALHRDKPGRPTRPYRARYRDTTDHVTRQLRDI